MWSIIYYNIYYRVKSFVIVYVSFKSNIIFIINYGHAIKESFANVPIILKFVFQLNLMGNILSFHCTRVHVVYAQHVIDF